MRGQDLKISGAWSMQAQSGGKSLRLDFPNFDIPDAFGRLDFYLVAFLFADQSSSDRRIQRNGAFLTIRLVRADKPVGADFSRFEIFHDHLAPKDHFAV